MCNVYRSVGSLTTIKSHLQRNNVTGLTSLNELIAFQKNYSTSRQQIISEHELSITQEKNDLNSEISQLDQLIKVKKTAIEEDLRKEIEELKQQLHCLSTSSKNIIRSLINYFKKHLLKRKIRNSELNFDSKISFELGQSINTLTEKNNRYHFITSHFNDAVQESSRDSLWELERKKKVIDEINNSIYGAIGEQKVVKELENLSNDYFLINDFCLSFSSPIYNRQENDHIRSIQIDHLLVSPFGVFLIETKNWSDQSLNNLSLRSPVQQIKRTNFALYKLLSGEIPGLLNLNQHHWGERKIPIKNLIVLTNHKPNEEFQYVKIVTLSELLSYIKYFKPSFSSTETQVIANYLVNLSRNHSA
jgi:hypothetical protein